MEASSAPGALRRLADRGSAHHVRARRPHALLLDLDETLLDSLATDVAGAKAAGVCAVWLNRHGAPIDDDSSPDIEVASLSEVATRLVK